MYITESDINKLIQITSEAIKNNQKSKERMTIESFIKEFATVELKLPRNIGKTIAIVDFCNHSYKKILILVKNEYHLKQYSNKLYDTKDNITIRANTLGQNTSNYDIIFLCNNTKIDGAVNTNTIYFKIND